MIPLFKVNKRSLLTSEQTEKLLHTSFICMFALHLHTCFMTVLCAQCQLIKAICLETQVSCRQWPTVRGIFLSRIHAIINLLIFCRSPRIVKRVFDAKGNASRNERNSVAEKVNIPLISPHYSARTKPT